MNMKPGNHIQPCWRYQGEGFGSYADESLIDIWQSGKAQEIRRHMIERTDLPDECRSCAQLENSSTESTRTQCNKEFSDIKDHIEQSYTPDQLLKDAPFDTLHYMELRFDKKCNSSCRHCGPGYSSKWQTIYEANKEQHSDFFSYYVNDREIKASNSIVDEIVDLSKHCKKFMIAGGEPLIQDGHLYFLRSLKGKEKDIELSYSTNLSTLEYKSANFIDLWKDFKKVDIKISVDGEPNIYQYARHRSLNTNKLEQNVRKLHLADYDMFITGTLTLHIFNMTRYVDMIKYLIDLGIYVHTSQVQWPSAISAQVLPPDLKERLTNEINEYVKTLETDNVWNDHWYWSRYPKRAEKNIKRIKSHTKNALSYMNGDDLYMEEFHNTIDYIKTTDTMFGTSLTETFPEFKGYWNE